MRFASAAGDASWSRFSPGWKRARVAVGIAAGVAMWIFGPVLAASAAHDRASPHRDDVMRRGQFARHCGTQPT